MPRYYIDKACFEVPPLGEFCGPIETTGHEYHWLLLDEQIVKEDGCVMDGIKIIRVDVVCTSKVFMGDSDKVEGSEQMVKLAIQQFGFYGAHVAGVVVVDQKMLQRRPML